MIEIKAKFNGLLPAAEYVRGTKLAKKEAVLLFARHGKTIFNKEKKLQAWFPDEDRLSPIGQLQAQSLCLPVSLFPVRWVASSDMERAMQTARLAAPRHSVTPFLFLRDFDFGRFGGMTFKGEGSELERLYPRLHWTFHNLRSNFAAPGGERYADFPKRVIDGLLNVILPRSQGGVSFIVTHVGPLREILLKQILSSTIDQYKPAFDQASLSIIHFGRDGSPTLLLYNNKDHLPPED